MNKLFFRILVLLMSLSLIGIILVQVFWFNSSFKNNEEQFKYHVTQVIGNVADKLEQQEEYSFYDKYNRIKDSTGKIPKKEDLLQVFYVQRNAKTNKTIVYSNTLTSEDYDISGSFFNKKFSSERFKNFSSKRVTEVYNNNNGIDNNNLGQSIIPDLTIEKSGSLDILNKVQQQIQYKDIASLTPIEGRITKDKLSKLLKKELQEYGVKTKFEFGIYSSGVPTKIKSDGFHYDKEATYNIPIYTDNEGNSRYELSVTFPHKKKFLLSELLSITILSIVFTLIIIVAYTSALNQLLRQKHISEIKTDFINNMTHEFKTPIATINLALDAIRNPKIIEDKDKVFRYLQMIRDENKRMHAQVENVLRISKLEKRELDITKEPTVVTDVIDDAIEHVNLILEDRKGTVVKHYNAARTTCLINEVHFTNVLVNILENAIKYSPDIPEIEIFTENVKDMILIKVRDHGLGMSKIAQKRVFEKFYREHTGDLHNVKGHGLGLAYVKRIVEDHNGQVYVESEKGKGSTFIIKIPLIN
ncbi:two-component system, OmpR family, phosphate regulon sensor histidine kinase PhoR [Flavobacterium sp. CF108]|uniref:sensor histidine kinase n=1 Tax=unclassified Flavobacterium TaxID=196869 RepID=UPI0008C456F5|nr:MULTISPECIES: HAMP domain-containing sensor histidine kinase [unclassified Flavobacterium]SEO11206.1 two-component system, OmpR family, phosphate regulon sensor histidine kinase PhoR [Flavobacterium sp. fv08]SHG61440.1 two-component system, OmpR family, phosphate regulon sensor histidine kinase PhoR [Flavobacterium sp. CF108]